MRPSFYSSLSKNLKLMDEMLLMNQTDDIVRRDFQAMGLDCALFYVEGMSDGDLMAQNILRPLLRCTEEASGQAALDMAVKRLIEAVELKTEKEPHAAISELMRGQCLVLLDTVGEAVLVDIRKFVHRSVETPQRENVVIGPHEAFNESLRDNLTLLHRKLMHPDFICEQLEVGTRVSTQITLCYLNGVCPKETVEELRHRLNGAALDNVLSSGMLEQLIEDDPYAPLPQVADTERPDRAVSFMLEGQAVVLMDGSPRAFAMPMNLWHLFHAPDDSYMRWQYGTFMRLVRVIGALLALLLPAVFVSAVIYHPMSLPMTLLTSIMQSRTVVPLSLLGEAVLMVFVFDLINEAGTRVPGLMGSTLGLVGALILGTAAVQAALVSPLLIIIVALAGLGSYVLPNYPLSFALRMGQLLILIVGGLLGLVGVCMAVVLLLCTVAGMTSLGQPYLAPVSPSRAHNPDLILRAPVFRQRLRAYLANPAHMKRTSGKMRKFP